MDSDAVASAAAFKMLLQYFCRILHRSGEAAMARFLAFAIATMALANSTNAMAQYDVRQCTRMIDQLTAYMRANAVKPMISLAREIATYCQDDYALALEALSNSLNGDNQHDEALAVADRCLQTNNAEVLLFCLRDKAAALYGLGRFREAKATIERALREPAIRTRDVTTKQNLRVFLAEVNAAMEPVDLSAYGDPLPDNPVASPNQTPSSRRADVPLTNSAGIFTVPVEINGAITLEFALDSGAADVCIPLDVFSTLKRAGTVRDSDILGQKTYFLADGSKSQSVTFKIRSLKVGDKRVENVTGSVTPSGGTLLLGQSFLGRFKSWSIDNAQHKLVLEP
jgi:clan AA aspartic protease (TIGR02281 family)